MTGRPADDALDRLEKKEKDSFTAELRVWRRHKSDVATVRDELQRLREENDRQKTIIEEMDECGQRVEGLRLPGGVTPIYTCRRAYGHPGPHSEFPVQWTENS